MANSAFIFLLGVGKLGFPQPKKETELGKEEVRRKITKKCQEYNRNVYRILVGKTLKEGTTWKTYAYMVVFFKKKV